VAAPDLYHVHAPESTEVRRAALDGTVPATVVWSARNSTPFRGGVSAALEGSEPALYLATDTAVLRYTETSGISALEVCSEACENVVAADSSGIAYVHGSVVTVRGARSRSFPGGPAADDAFRGMELTRDHVVWLTHEGGGSRIWAAPR
jgi:hypothetical protein